MTDYDFGDVVLVPFPFTDQTGSKKRPAVVVSSSAYHHSRADIIIAAITSQTQLPSSLGEVSVASWKQTGLIKPSVIKPVLATIEKRLVIRRLGSLEKPDRTALLQMLQEILGE